jgi:glycosyltransferase involved in cell wall biosynthesis
LKTLIAAFKPDIAHVHNIYGRLTPSVLDLLTKKKIPIIMTLHDYKLVCPSYLFMHNGRVCEACIRDRFYMSVLKRCHKESYAASAIVALESYINKWLKKYRKNVGYYIAPSCFLKDKLIECRWPAQQIRHIPNFLNISKFDPQFIPGNYFLYLGRLSEEKGIDTLIQAFIGLNQEKIGLTIAGEGPMRGDLERLSHGNPAIKFTGYLSGEQLRKITQNALSIIIPSICYENAPISLLEAMAYGKPVIGARIGGIPEMIKDRVNGFLFEAGNCDALKIVMEHCANLPAARIEEIGRAAHNKVKNENSMDTHYGNLMEVYQEALKRREK